MRLARLICLALVFGGCGGGGGGGTEGPTIAEGRCGFTTARLPGGGDGALTGAGYATLNGASNVQVHCGNFDGPVGPDGLQIAIGNGNYFGPRDYWLDPSIANGSLTLDSGELSFSSRYAPFGGSCLLTVTDAVPRMHGDPPPAPGSTIAGVFECTEIGVANRPDTIDLLDGEFRVVLR